MYTFMTHYINLIFYIMCLPICYIHKQSIKDFTLLFSFIKDQQKCITEIKFLYYENVDLGEKFNMKFQRQLYWLVTINQLSQNWFIQRITKILEKKSTTPTEPTNISQVVYNKNKSL